MTNDLKLPPGREPLRSDWFVEQLGASQQKVMSLTVQNRALEKRLEVAEHRAEVLKELVFDIVLDMQENVLKSAILERIRKVTQKLDGEDQ